VVKRKKVGASWYNINKEEQKKVGCKVVKRKEERNYVRGDETVESQHERETSKHESRELKQKNIKNSTSLGRKRNESNANKMFNLRHSNLIQSLAIYSQIWKLIRAEKILLFYVKKNLGENIYSQTRVNDHLRITTTCIQRSPWGAIFYFIT
jgi:hypothetical protein